MKLETPAIALAAAALVATPAHAGEKVLFGKPPAWVVEHPAGTEPSQSGNLPVEFLQVDTQDRFEGQTETTFTLVRMKFLASQGLQAGNLSYSWEPDKGDLTVNRVLIHRGDKTIDVLGEGQTFTVLRREQGLEQAMLDGSLTANMFPEGLQVGDVLEAAVTITRTDPVVGNHAEARFGPLNFPAGRIDLSVQWPVGRTMSLASSPDMPQWARAKADGFETATISLQDVKPLVPPSGAPDRYKLIRMAQVSDYQSWDQVAAVNVPLYAKASVIPADGPLRAEIDKIRAADKDPAARAEAALQLVQNRIRYVALEMGAGGLVPADAATTWSRRYGDCKAKTALLIGILRELGIEAEPVVVNTGIGDAIASRLPAVGLFDHILVRATIAGKTYWLDGTRTGDTSLARLKVPNFSWGLPIRKGVTGLVRMVPPPLEQPESDLAIDFDASAGGRGPVPARLELTLRGDDAIGTNQALDALVGNARQEALRKYWRGRFDFIDPQTFDISFDQRKGELHLTMQGTATLDWKDGWYETDETGVGYRADFSRAPGVEHDAPFAVAYPIFEHTRETILLPPGFTGKVTSDKTDVDETIGGFEYHRHATLTGNKFVVERSERSLVPEIAYSEAVAAQKRLRDLSDDAVYLRIPESYPPTPADLAVLTGTETDDPSELLQQGNTLARAGKYGDAIEKFKRATELDPKSADAWASRAFAAVQTGRLDEADDAVTRAAAIDSKNLAMLNARGQIEGYQRKFEAELNDASAVLAVDSKNQMAMINKGSALSGLGRTKEALAIADELIALKPLQTDGYTFKAFIEMANKDREGAAKTIDGMVAAIPGDPSARALAEQIYDASGYPEKARALAEKLNSSQTTPLELVNHSHLRGEGDDQGKLNDLDAALKLDPEFGPALLARAQLFEAEGKEEDALADLNIALRNSPSYPPLLSQRARVLVSLDKDEEALEDLDKAISGNPKWLELYLQKANVLSRLDRKDDTLKVASQLTSVSPDETYAHVAAAKIYVAFGDRSKALAEIDRALAIKPEAYIYVNRADILPSNDFDGKLADLEKALKIDPQMIEALEMKARVLKRKGDNAAAVALYSKLLEKDPQNWSYHDERGIALWHMGKHNDAMLDFVEEQKFAKTAKQLNSGCYEKATANVGLEVALDECEKSLKLDPGASYILDSRATVYLQMGKYADAIRDFDSALQKSPRMVSSLMGRAIAKLRLGDLAGARADVAAARKIDSRAIEYFQNAGITVPQELTT